MVPNFIFVSFFRTECLHDSKLQVNAPFNNPCVANTCKECKPTCPSLEFHNLKESPSKHSEAAKFSVNALFFKYYKLLHRMPFRTTNEPLNILRMPSLKVPLKPVPPKFQSKSHSSSTDVHTSHLSTLSTFHLTA